MKKIRKIRSRFNSKRRPINVLASAITTFSLYLGLSSVFCTMREDYKTAAYLILASIVCDMLDGTVARITKTMSDFGKELDSLADVVAFGVAPAVLIYHAYLYEERLVGTAVGLTGAMMAIIFAICAALRLARFNVYQSGQRESFTGLPTPAAGGTVASFVLFAHYFELHVSLNVAYWVLGPLTLGLAYLMVSTVRYPKDRLKKAFILAPHSAFRMLAISAVVIAIFHYAITHHPVIVLFPLCMSYVLFGVGDQVVSLVQRRRRAGSVVAGGHSPESGGRVFPASASNKDDRL